MEQLLKNIPIFSGLNRQELSRIAAITQRKKVPKRKFVFVEGEEKRAVYFIQSGLIKTFKLDEDGNEQVISLLYKGDMFPHTGFFNRSPYPAHAQVVQDAEILSIAIQDFNRLLRAQPDIAIKVMKIMEQKIAQLQERIQEFISKDVFHRLIRLLIRIANEQGHWQGKSVYIEIPITHLDFANMIGTSRESINRILNKLKKDQIIEMDRRGIHILNIEQLRAYDT